MRLVHVQLAHLGYFTHAQLASRDALGADVVRALPLYKTLLGHVIVGQKVKLQFGSAYILITSCLVR